MPRSTRAFAVLASAFIVVALPARAQQVPAAIFTDPPHDAQHPARMEVLHIPSGGVNINGVAYLAAGPGAHPTFILLHGLPGNEKNLDLAQAVRRAGWNAITFNYRGSWGSPGSFSFLHNIGDAAAVLTFLHDSSNVKSLGIDTTRLVIGGHSMGGWVTVHTAANQRGLRGAVLISAADMTSAADRPRDRVVAMMASDMESLAGTSPQQMADEVRSLGGMRFSDAYGALARLPMLVVTSNDGLAPSNDSLVAAVRSRGNTRVTTVHFATDHSYSDKRIALESAVIRWLQGVAK
jgi:pimeloyl-ACP methyl ester carboxylesterase